MANKVQIDKSDPLMLEILKTLDYLKNSVGREKRTLSALQGQVTLLNDKLDKIIAENKDMMARLEGLVDEQMVFDIAEELVESIKAGRSKEDILEQIRFLLDREGQKAIVEGREEYKAGKTKSCKSAKELVAELDKT
jgi:hypothetical protein